MIILHKDIGQRESWLACPKWVPNDYHGGENKYFVSKLGDLMQTKMS